MQRFIMILMCYPIINFQEELDALKARLEKVEKEKNEYKVAAEKFESRVRSFIAWHKMALLQWRHENNTRFVS